MSLDIFAFILFYNIEILIEKEKEEKQKEEEKCHIEECHHTLLPNQPKYCTLHTCFNTKCHNKRLISRGDRHPYCIEHSCDKKDCHLPANKKSLSAKHCLKHKCHHISCYKLNETGTMYCLGHVCKYKNCTMKCQDNGQFCKNHGCSKCKGNLDEFAIGDICFECSHS